MLVLTRKQGERLQIGDDVVVTVLEVHGRRIRLGIEAPTEIPVHRQEVYEAIQRENLHRNGAGMNRSESAAK